VRSRPALTRPTIRGSVRRSESGGAVAGVCCPRGCAATRPERDGEHDRAFHGNLLSRDTPAVDERLNTPESQRLTNRGQLEHRVLRPYAWRPCACCLGSRVTPLVHLAGPSSSGARPLQCEGGASIGVRQRSLERCVSAGNEDSLKKTQRGLSANQRLTTSSARGGLRQHEPTSKAQFIRTKRHDAALTSTRRHHLCGIPASAPDFARARGTSELRLGRPNEHLNPSKSTIVNRLPNLAAWRAAVVTAPRHRLSADERPLPVR
jgi:hypothetical protein